ncbi:ankyrin and het domain-containing protein, partial [Colletotrichum incanum]
LRNLKSYYTLCRRWVVIRIKHPSVSAHDMATSCHTHIFRPLASYREIRLLYLAPGKGNVAVHGRLQHVNLDHAPLYEAGSPERNHQAILQNGSTLNITESLYNALRDIRHEEMSQGSRTVWADAICINQEDVEERQQQVSMMGSIYREASRVITYIGPEKDDSSLALSIARDLYNRTLSRYRDHGPISLSAQELNSIERQLAFEPHWMALRALVLRTWSSRCWCAHEFLLNRNLLMMCGRTELSDWYLIPAIVQHVVNGSLPRFLLPYSPDDPISTRECLRSLMLLRSHQLDLLTLLKGAHPFQSTDPRDKVYSLLGLAVDRDDIALEIDYSCKAEQLYITVANKILAKSPTLGILYSNLNKKSLTLPSWVPDWSTWQFGSNGAAHYFSYAACAATPPELRVHTSRDKLDISGCFVDTIVEISDRIEPYYKDHHGPGLRQRKTWLKEQAKIVGRLEPYPDGSGISDVLWRTLIGNVTLEEAAAGDDYKAFFYAHLNCCEHDSAGVKKMATDYCDAVRRRSRYRCLAVTGKGYFGAIRKPRR